MDKIATWTCDWCNRTSRPLTDVRVEYNDSLNIMSFVGYLEDHNASACAPTAATSYR